MACVTPWSGPASSGSSTSATCPAAAGRASRAAPSRRPSRGAGIVYEHRRELGNPAAIRAVYRSGDRDGGRKAYRAHLLGDRWSALGGLAEAAVERPTAMLCLEDDQAACHRDVIAEELVRRHPAIRVEPI